MGIFMKGVLMRRNMFVYLYILVFLFTLGADGFARERESSEAVINELRQEIQKIREQMEAEKQTYEERLKEMQEKIVELLKKYGATELN